MNNLDKNIIDFFRVSLLYKEKLNKAGLRTVRDLLLYFPYRYDDFSSKTAIAELKINEIATIQGRIVDITNRRSWRNRRMVLTEALVEDETGSARAVWFNQPYLVRSLSKGATLSLAGKTSVDKQGLVFSNPAFELFKIGEALAHTGRIIPIYREAEGITSKWLRLHIQPLLRYADEFEEFLPDEVLQPEKLMGLARAVKEIHFPPAMASAEAAKKRLAFDELLMIQLRVQRNRLKIQKEKAPAIKFNKELVKNFVEELPFILTDDQRRAAWEIIQDLEKPTPMNRLLEGDVGSGKTVVAAIAVLEVIQAGFQVALMAPTEILADQHYKNFLKHMIGYKVALLTGSSSLINKNKVTYEEILRDIKNGIADIVIGTHALIQDKVQFKNLALVVVDEQHKFGIEQRAKLVKTLFSLKDGLPDKVPHLLSMTATPIPRTLALSLWGDLDISLLRQMPKGRRKILTKVVAPANLAKAHQFIREEIKKGRQAFIIYPLVEESPHLEAKAVTAEHKRLTRDVFPDLRLGLLHGRMKPKEKEEVMGKFKNGQFDILISTSVVEVGIDVPNASVMIIEGADRFGLAQLHQFRGRVGRGEHQSYCFLFTESAAKNTSQRLRALTGAASGFELAEKDLQIRGPGEFLGSKQSGLPDLAMASLNDLDLIKQTRRVAQELLERNPELENNKFLKEKLEKFEQAIHME